MREKNFKSALGKEKKKKEKNPTPASQTNRKRQNSIFQCYCEQTCPTKVKQPTAGVMRSNRSTVLHSCG